MELSRFQRYRDAIVGSCGRVIVGKEEAVALVATAFVCSGHVLLEDLPGTGKTMLLRAFAKTVGGTFRRVQFTPDLLPSDLTGLHFFDQKEGEFRFRPGPLFANIVLADEINRATPRTQSSLLEAMEERQITVDGVTFRLQEPFLVMATQNPLESYGTFPLPDAQVDRFFLRLSLGRMTREQEESVVIRRSAQEIVEELVPAVRPEETEWVRREYARVRVSRPVLGYLMDIIEATRALGPQTAGVSTRGAIALYRAAQVTAAFAGRDYVIPEDVKYLAPHVLGHRLSAGAAEGREIVERILHRVAVPLEEP